MPHDWYDLATLAALTLAGAGTVAATWFAVVEARRSRERTDLLELQVLRTEIPARWAEWEEEQRRINGIRVEINLLREKLDETLRPGERSTLEWRIGNQEEALTAVEARQNAVRETIRLLEERNERLLARARRAK